MKYRKKPVVIDASQFTLQDAALFPTVCYGWPKSDDDNTPHEMDGKYWIPTLEGRHIVSDGDWIITGVKNEQYPCKDEIFKLTYELAE